MDDLKFPFEIVECCYQSTIYNQQISYRLLQESFTIYESPSTIFYNIKEWLKAQVSRLNQILNKWSQAIINFFTKTIPSIIKPIADRIINVLNRLLGHKKKVDIPKDTPKDQKDKIKDAVNSSNDIIKESLFNKELIDAQEKLKDVSEKIYSIQDDNIRQEIINAIKEKNIIILNGQKEDEILAVQCKDIHGKLKISLSAILTACSGRQELLESLSTPIADIIENPLSKKGFENSKGVDSIFSTLDNDDKETMDLFIDTKYIQTIRYLRKHKEYYSIEDLNNQNTILIKIKDIEKYIKELECDKNKDNILDSVNKQVKIIKDLSETLVSSCKNQSNVQELLKMISTVQNAMTIYLTSASKDYGNFISYGISEFTNALKYKIA